MSEPDTRTLDVLEARLHPQPCVIVLSGACKGTAFWIETSRIVFGRDADCDVRLPDGSVSRRHAALERGADGFVLEDLGSKNGTFVGNAALEERTALRDGDLFRLGQVGLQFFTVQALAIDRPHVATRSGPLTLDPQRQQALIEDRAVELTATEFALLAALMHRPGRVLSALALMRAAWPRERIVSEATVASHLRNLRRKLSERTDGFDPIRSVYGRGYRISWERDPD
jgi:DNA-binding response OmpR family regulator